MMKVTKNDPNSLSKEAVCLFFLLEIYSFHSFTFLELGKLAVENTASFKFAFLSRVRLHLLHKEN